MTTRFVVSGTDTGIGKTVFSAVLTAALDGYYWKPVQSGLDEETDSQAVARLAGLPQGRILSEVYKLTAPLSPHQSAALDGTAIAADAFAVPATEGPLVIEGAGGLLVPLSDDLVLPTYLPDGKFRSSFAPAQTLVRSITRCCQSKR